MQLTGFFLSEFSKVLESTNRKWQKHLPAKPRPHVAGRIKGVCAGCNCDTCIELPKFGSSLHSEI